MHEQGFESLASLEKEFENRTCEFCTTSQGETLERNTIGTEGFYVRVVDERDSVQIDYSKVGHCTLEFVYVDDFIYFGLFLFDCLFVGSDQMQDFEAVDEVVNLSHEPFHENDL